MADKTPLGPLIATNDGYYLRVFSDGSFVKFDQSLNVVAQDDTPNPQRAALMASGDDAAAAATAQRASVENARRWDLNFGLQQQQSRSNTNYQNAQAQNIRDRLNFDRENAAADRAQRESEFGRTFGLNQAQLGYNLLKTGVDYHNNPADYFNEAEWTRGVAGNPQTSTFLSALQSNTRLPSFVARGSPAEVADLGGLTAKLAGGGTTDNSGNYLAQIGNIGAKGPQQLGAGALEQLTPTERSLFTGGLAKLGYDPTTFLAGYGRSRIGQGIGGSGYRAA